MLSTANREGQVVRNDNFKSWEQLQEKSQNKRGGAAGAQSYNSKETDPANNLTERGGRFFPILCPQWGHCLTDTLIAAL